MYNGTQFSFQVDSRIVQDTYNSQQNYLIDFDYSSDNRNSCAVYFSSNVIYFPNDQDTFIRRVVNKNCFEWYASRIQGIFKHIFIRDVYKQWYLKGINSTINSPDKLQDFIREETKGMEVVCVGSSAGGYAAVLYGTQLHAKRVFAFNAQFEIKSLLTTDEKTNPLIFRLQNTELLKFYDLCNLLDFATTNIYYFFSNKSQWDISQRKHIDGLSGINIIEFDNHLHGVPFPKIALEKIFKLPDSDLRKLTRCSHNPIMFSIQMVGVYKTIVGIYRQYINSRKR